MILPHLNVHAGLLPALERRDAIDPPRTPTTEIDVAALGR